MPNMMAALPNIGGAVCSTPQSLADAHYYTVSQNSSHLLTVCNFVKPWLIFKNFALLESVRNLLQKRYDITHLTLGILLHYLGK